MDKRDEKTGPGFQHNQSAELVDETRRKADAQVLASQEPNELGQQPMTEPRKKLSPQELRERPRE